VNKTLLIIICDFLLISILALVEFNPSVEEALVDDQSLKEEAAEEMLELLQLSLEHESSQRREVENLLESTEDELGQTRQSLDETTASLQETSSSLEKSLEEKSQLASSLKTWAGWKPPSSPCLPN
jgi:septal ring factor EnvC (AmiA/AmiB activator)